MGVGQRGLPTCSGSDFSAVTVAWGAHITDAWWHSRTDSHPRPCAGGLLLAPHGILMQAVSRSRPLDLRAAVEEKGCPVQGHE